MKKVTQLGQQVPLQIALPRPTRVLPKAQQASLCGAIFTPDLLSSPRAQNLPSLADSLPSPLDWDLGVAASAPSHPSSPYFRPSPQHKATSQ